MEDGRRKTKERGTEDGRQETGDGRRKKEDGGWKIEIGRRTFLSGPYLPTDKITTFTFEINKKINLTNTIEK